MRLGPQQQGVPSPAGCCADGLDVIRPSVQPVGLYDRNAAMSALIFATVDSLGFGLGVLASLALDRHRP